MAEGWDGTERRAEDARFTKAMSDVRDLKNATSDLAEAVKVKTDTLHQILIRIAQMLAIMLLINIVLSFVFVTGLNRHMDSGHDEILCTLTLTPEQKIALGDLACK